MSHSFHLLRTRRFAPLFVTQFLGAFNDNLLKNALVVLLTFHAGEWSSLSVGLLVNLAAGLFILPFFLFSASAGQLADKFDKALIARWVKALEILLMGIAAVGLFAHSLSLLLVALFLFGLHSTLFGPVKYAILPQHLAGEELVGGNALIEAATFIAILFGTLAGGLLAGAAAAPLWIALSGLIVALAGFFASCAIPPARAPQPNLPLNPNPLSETWRNLLLARANPPVWVALIGISWFWLYGALLLTQFPTYARTVLGGNEAVVTLLLAVFSFGIGVGALLCARLSRQRVEMGLVLPGLLGLTVFGLDLACAAPQHAAQGAPAAGLLSISALLGHGWAWHVLADVAFTGICGGLLTVPLYTLLQTASAVEARARAISANNILNALFMVGGALLSAVLLDAGLSIPALFGLAAVGNLLTALWLSWRAPDYRRRFVGFLRRSRDLF